jgi:hypothetical protein
MSQQQRVDLPLAFSIFELVMKVKHREARPRNLTTLQARRLRIHQVCTQLLPCVPIAHAGHCCELLLYAELFILASSVFGNDVVDDPFNALFSKLYLIECCCDLFGDYGPAQESVKTTCLHRNVMGIRWPAYLAVDPY